MRLVKEQAGSAVWFIVALLLLFLLLVAPVQCYVDVVVIPVGKADVRVYVIALENIEGHGVVNVSDTVEGVLYACRNNMTWFHADEFLWLPWTFGEIEINTSSTVVAGWGLYRQVVESGSDIVIVNAHGETIPVPAGYSNEEWVDKIADAIANRSVTWVHTAGYPFYYYHAQGVGNGTWGEEGFQRLMSHIGLGHVTCWPPDYQTKKIDMDHFARQNLKDAWPALRDALRVELGRPLNGSDFNDYICMPIWGVPEDYTTGAVVRFSSGNKSSFGFYVHAGTYQTFDENDNPTEADYMRGLASAAGAIWACTYKAISEGTILDAEEAIVEAEAQGRIKGLDEARQLLEEAKQSHNRGSCVASLKSAYLARKAANYATSLSFFEKSLPYLLASIGGVTIVGVLVVVWNRKSKKVAPNARSIEESAK